VFKRIQRIEVLKYVQCLSSAQYWVHGKRKIGRPKGEASNIVPRPKKKRGRKRLLASTKVEGECDEEETNMETAGDIQRYVLRHDRGLNVEGKYLLITAFTCHLCVTLQLSYKCRR
jgi:hypothetical protein